MSDDKASAPTSSEGACPGGRGGGKSPFAARFQAANAQLAAGEVEAAVAAYEALRQERPGKVALLCKLADARARLGHADAAVLLYQRALEIDDRLIPAHKGLAKLHALENDHDAAIAVLDRALQGGRDPKSVSGLLADQLLKAGRQRVLDDEVDAAERMFWRALSLIDGTSGTGAKLRNALASIQAAEGRFDKAIAILRPIGAAATKRIETLRDQAAFAEPARLLVADGREDDTGRALLLISALHLAVPRLGRTRVRFLCVGDDIVRAAIEALAWETGLEVEARNPARPTGVDTADPAKDLSGAAGYVAVAFRDADRLAPFEAEAARLGIPCLTAVQFCDADAPPQTLALECCAHDSRRLADRIVEMVLR